MNARERLTRLVEDAEAAASGGHATVAERLLQHRELLVAIREQIDANARLRDAVLEMLALVRLYPVYSTDFRDGSAPTRHRWGLRPGKAEAFDRAIEKLSLIAREPTA